MPSWSVRRSRASKRLSTPLTPTHGACFKIGVQPVWDRDGNKLGELVYRDGKATGTLVEVDDDGRPLRKVEYREGEIVAHEALPTEVEAGR